MENPNPKYRVKLEGDIFDGLIQIFHEDGLDAGEMAFNEDAEDIAKQFQDWPGRLAELAAHPDGMVLQKTMEEGDR